MGAFHVFKIIPIVLSRAKQQSYSISSKLWFAFKYLHIWYLQENGVYFYWNLKGQCQKLECLLGLDESCRLKMTMKSFNEILGKKTFCF